ncbi:MAG: Com family DNA-binding transcriptional regulator [Prolixibacteraceae bacterium]|nr:Com family DNA-binding transcriptional regulator [Prolixibacteraceae bacterium]
MITINGKEYKELRCAKCQKFFIYQNVSAGILCMQCPRCGFLNEYVFKYLKTDDNEKMIKKSYSLTMRGETK